MAYERSAGVVVFRNWRGRRYLLLHYEEGHWDFPKGHVEEKENDLEAAKRELKEETGISKIALLDGFSEKIHYFYKRKGKLMSKDVVFFAGKVGKSKVNLSKEHIGYVWLPHNEAIAKLTYGTAKNVLKKAEEFISSS